MTVWPALSPEPNIEAEPAPALDAARATPSSAPSPRRRWRMAAAIACSLAAHTAALAFFVDRMNRQGDEAAAEPVAVEIMVETPLAAAEPSFDSAPNVAEAETVSAVEEDIATLRPEEAIEPMRPASEPERLQATEPQPAEPIVPNDDKLPPVAKAATLVAAARPVETLAPVGENLEAVAALDAAEAETFVPPPPSLTLFGEPPATEAEIPLPRIAAIPTEKPVQRKQKTELEPKPPVKPKPRRKALAAADPGKAEPDRPSPDRKGQKTDRTIRTAAVSGAGGAGASASKASKAAPSAGSPAQYGRKLLGHVERHKRYPAAAERQRITGATRLSITIDRSGNLAGARVTGASGHGVLDQEALAVARRAAPYPKPPEGVGGRTFSFAVTLRFRK